MECLAQLVTEWYEHQGYFVRNGLWVGLESDGSYERMLDVVAFHPIRHHFNTRRAQPRFTQLR